MILGGGGGGGRIHPDQVLVVHPGDPVPGLAAELVGPPVLPGRADRLVVPGGLTEAQRLPLHVGWAIRVRIGVPRDGCCGPWRGHRLFAPLQLLFAETDTLGLPLGLPSTGLQKGVEALLLGKLAGRHQMGGCQRLGLVPVGHLGQPG